MKRPNVLIVMSDQHHPRMMGCAGEPLVRTPAMDALAARGVRFDHAYCASPLCGPSRAAFMTGRLPTTMDCLTNQRQFDSDLPTFAHLFNEAGYETVLAGRMHFNGPDQRHGFHKRLLSDVLGAYRKHMSGLNEALGEGLRNTTGPSANAIVKSGPGRCGYQAFDEAIAAAAAAWLTSRRDERPFMLTVGFVLPHAPFVAPPEDFDHYDKLITEDDLPQPCKLHPEMMRLKTHAKLVGETAPTKKDQRRARVAYYGMCTHVDRQLGVVLDALDAAGLTDDTIVVYTSDHGEQLGEHGMWWKHTFYEASVGVPLIFAGPGVPRGGAAPQNVSLIDIGATVLDMAGANPIPGAVGRSFKCLLDGDAAAWHDTVYSENLWPPDAPCIHRMVKRGPWKLNHYHGFEPELFNVADDPGEVNDRAADPACAAIRAELTELVLRGWDHDAVLARQRAMRVMEMMALRAREACDMPDPDEPWHEGELENWFDDSR